MWSHSSLLGSLQTQGTLAQLNSSDIPYGFLFAVGDVPSFLSLKDIAVRKSHARSFIGRRMKKTPCKQVDISSLTLQGICFLSRAAKIALTTIRVVAEVVFSRNDCTLHVPKMILTEGTLNFDLLIAQTDKISNQSQKVVEGGKEWGFHSKAWSCIETIGIVQSIFNSPNLRNSNRTCGNPFQEWLVALEQTAQCSNGNLPCSGWKN